MKKDKIKRNWKGEPLLVNWVQLPQRDRSPWGGGESPRTPGNSPKTLSRIEEERVSEVERMPTVTEEEVLVTAVPGGEEANP